MLFRLILALAFAGFLGAVTLPGYTIAQTTQTEEKEKKETKKETKKKATKTKEEKDEPKKKTEKEKEKKEKKLTPAQQRMKDCGAKWQEHKKETGEKTKSQYNAFLKKCLKKDD